MSPKAVKKYADEITRAIRALPLAPEKLEEAQQAIRDSFELENPSLIYNELKTIHEYYSGTIE